MGILDRFKKKKKEDSDLELPSLPETESVKSEELPPLPEIKVEPEGVPAVTESSSEKLEEKESLDSSVSDESASEELPDLPEIDLGDEPTPEPTPEPGPEPEPQPNPEPEPEPQPEPEPEPVQDEEPEVEEHPMRRTPVVRRPARTPLSAATPVPSSAPSHIFVSSNDYRKILDGVEFLKEKLDMSDEFINSLTFIKNEEEKHIESMRNTLEDIQRKITYVDEVIFQAG